MTETIWFDAPISVDDTIAEGYMKHFVSVPGEIARHFDAGHSRLRGSIEGTPFSRAIVRTPDGQIRVRFGMSWLRDAGLSVGDVVRVVLDEDQDPDRVDVPQELEALLDANPVAEHAWEELTAGRRRSLVYEVERAKRPETRQRRARAVVDEVLTEFGVG